MTDSIRRQMERLLATKTDEHTRGHIYKWREIHPKHRLGRVKTKLLTGWRWGTRA